MIRVYTEEEFYQNFYNWQITDITLTSNLHKLSSGEQSSGRSNIDEYFIVFYPNSLEKAIDAMVEILVERLRPDEDINLVKARIKKLLGDFKPVLMTLFSKVNFPLVIIYFHYNYSSFRTWVDISNINAHVYVLGSTNNNPSMIIVPKALYIQRFNLLNLEGLGIVNSDDKAQISTKGYNTKPNLYLFILNLKEGSDLHEFLSIHPIFKGHFKHKILQSFNINQQALERMLNDKDTGYHDLISIVYKKIIDKMMAKGDYKKLVMDITNTVFGAHEIYDILWRGGALYYLNDIVEYCIDAVIENILTDMISNIMNQNPEINTYEEIIDHISFEELENRVRESCLEYIRNTLVIDPHFVYTYIFSFLVEGYYDNDTDMEFIESILSYVFDRNRIKFIKRLLYSIRTEAHRSRDVEYYYELIADIKEELINKYLREYFLNLYDQQPDLFIGELREFMEMVFPELFPKVWKQYVEQRLPHIISNIIA